MVVSGTQRRNREGAAAVEFALVGPIFVLLLCGMVVYGGWFWLAQSVQSLAAESTRAALSGLDVTERTNLARAAVAEQSGVIAGLDPSKASVTVVSDDKSIRVSVAYDIHDHPIMSLAGLVPSPPMVIVRSAVLRTGGY